MNALDDWSYAVRSARRDRQRMPPPVPPPQPQKHVHEGLDDGATLIMGRWNVWCGACQSKITDRMPEDEIACPDCGAYFFFIRPADEPLVPEDYKVIESVAQATGLVLSGC